jgi:uncharacterized protein HemX
VEGAKPKRPGFLDTLRKGWRPPSKAGSKAAAPDKPDAPEGATAPEKGASEDGASTASGNGASTTSTETAPTEVVATGAAATATAKAEPKEEAKDEATKATPGAPDATGAKPPPDLAGRIDGLRGWLDQIERRQGRIAYFGGTALVLALAAGAAGLYFGVTTHNDAAKKSDLTKIRQQIEKDIATLQTGVAQASQGRTSVDQTLSSLQQQIRSLQTTQQSTNQQIAALASAKSNTPTTPAATQAPKVTKKK